MLKRVIGPDGTVWHDCDAAGCDVSWDGYDIRSRRPADGRGDPPHLIEVDAVDDELVRVRETRTQGGPDGPRTRVDS